MLKILFYVGKGTIYHAQFMLMFDAFPYHKNYELKWESKVHDDTQDKGHV